MTCRELTEFLDMYLDGECPPDMKRQFDAHIRICPDCQAYLDSYAQAVRLAQSAGGESEPDEIPESIVVAILSACGQTNIERNTQ